MRFVDSWTARLLAIRDPQKIAALIVHTTGETDFDKCLKFYKSKQGFQPHYLIDLKGVIFRTARENQVAYHAKIEAEEATAYEQGLDYWPRCRWIEDHAVLTLNRLPNYTEWLSTWEPLGKKSPLDLITGRYPNSRTVGIELLQPTAPTADIFTDDQYIALAALCIDISVRNHFPLDRSHVLGHYDVSPMRRSTSRGSWDPGANFNWKRLLLQGSKEKETP